MHFIKRFDLVLGVLFVFMMIVLWWKNRTSVDVPEASQ
jgi:hypothetical protein